jgi:hypothetical protein
MPKPGKEDIRSGDGVEWRDFFAGGEGVGKQAQPGAHYAPAR